MEEVLAVEARGITKRFGDTLALSDVDFDVREGEVHALVGQNGAGKSTLLKILQGVYQPDSGDIYLLGERVTQLGPQARISRGISMIFQDFSLVPTLSAADNIFLGREFRGPLRFTDRRAMQKEAGRLLSEIGVDMDPRTIVRDMSPGYQQMTEIAKAVARNAKVLIMDEPTASLARREVDLLFGLIRSLKERDVSIVYVSHRLEEVFAVADRITALRDGKHIVTAATKDLTIEQLVDHIVGRRVAAFEWKPRPGPQADEPILVVEGLSAAGGPFDVDLHLLPGEVLGLAGLMGSGRTELATALMGLRKHTSGRVVVDGKEVPLGNPSAAVEAGMALVPENRRTQGLVPIHSVRSNIALPIVDRYSSMGFVRDRQVTSYVVEMVDRLDVRPRSLARVVNLLSGGNAQKVVIGKWLATNAKVLILDEPTAGIDIGTKAQIIELVRDLASRGMGILVTSSDLSELAAMADRFLLMSAGRIVGEVSQEEISGNIDRDLPPAEVMAQVKQYLELRVQQSSVKAGVA